MGIHNKELVDIFEDTKNIVSNYERDSSTEKYWNQYFRDKGTPIVSVVNSDTVSYLQSIELDKKVCLLNMASPTTAGGGVAKGTVAQEECLFRCSNLFETVIQDFYPIERNKFLYSKNVIFYKDFNYNLIDPIKADVITCAAINLNKESFYDFETGKWINVIKEEPDYYDIVMEDKIMTMISFAIKNNCDELILGAFGCGVFKNNPVRVANMFKQIIDKGWSIPKITFAIIDDNNSTGSNYKTFKDILES